MTDQTETADALDRIETGLGAVNDAADRASAAIASAFSRGIAQGRDFESVLRGLGQRLIDIGLRAAFKPLETGLSSLLSGLTSGLGAAVGQPLKITPFVEGGVIAAPHFFPTGQGLGLAGERGAEAILPLARGPDGRLGVATGGPQRAQPNITVSIATQDIDSFRRSETQIAAAMSRALARGQRGL